MDAGDILSIYTVIPALFFTWAPLAPRGAEDALIAEKLARRAEIARAIAFDR
jgi:hypothetical protein